MTERVIDEFRRSGIVAPELVREIQVAKAKRNGEIVTTEEVERFTREWIERRLARNAQKPKPVQHGDDSVERAIDHLTHSTPEMDAMAWAEAICTVENAWRKGEVTAIQQAQLDTVNARYARVG